MSPQRSHEPISGDGDRDPRCDSMDGHGNGRGGDVPNRDREAPAQGRTPERTDCARQPVARTSQAAVGPR